MMADSDGADKTTSPVPEPADKQTEGRPSVASRISHKARSMSNVFEESNPPTGFVAATSKFASSAIYGGSPQGNTDSPQQSTLSDLRKHAPVQRAGITAAAETEENANNQPAVASGNGTPGQSAAHSTAEAPQQEEGQKYMMDCTVPYDNGYHFPPSYPKGEAIKHGMMSFLCYFFTPLGFCVVIYGLNIVAWGGMLFLLLCNASPAMCHPTCNDIDSPRRVWIEIDAQVLTALFSATAFGLAPWRFRDLYYLLKYRLGKQQSALRRLAGIHRDWFRLPGSSVLPVELGPTNVEDAVARQDVAEAAVPEPAKKIPAAPLTGVRAPPTKVWKMDFMIWNMVLNTLFQCVLSGVMWGMNRKERPSWATGLFVALGCMVAAIGGLTPFIEGRRVKAVEGVPLTERDRIRLARDQALGIPHYNNLKDKPLKKAAKNNKAITDVEQAST